MALTPRYLSAFNGFVPKPTGQAVSFIKNPSEFKLNQYVQYIESPTTVGLYAYIDKDTPARIVTDEEFAWEDGAERPITNYNGLSFAWQEFATKRRNYATMLGDQSIAMAKDSWNALEHHVGALCQQAMTNRTNRIWTMLETAGNWFSNTADANTLNNGAGPWDKASDDPANQAYNAIKKSLLAAAKNIWIATRGNVRMKDLVLVLSPGAATAVASAPEIHSYLRNGPYSLPNIEGKGEEGTPNYNDEWGLPPTLYGFKLVIEDAVIVTDRPSSGGGIQGTASTNAKFIKSDTTAVILSRKGGIEGTYGSPSFSTVQMYWHEYLMAVYAFHDPENARVKLHTTDQFIEQLVAPEAGYLVTNIL